MHRIYRVLAGFCALGLAACGQGASAEDFKSTVGMSKDQIESLFGKPQSSSLESTDDHPGGFWIYKTRTGGTCKLRFDLPPRVLGADC